MILHTIKRSNTTTHTYRYVHTKANGLSILSFFVCMHVSKYDEAKPWENTQPLMVTCSRTIRGLLYY